MMKCPYHSQYGNDHNKKRSKLKTLLYSMCTCEKTEMKKNAKDTI